MLNGKRILLTGGTGSFGNAFVRHVIENYKPEQLVIFSRDELKQFEMAQIYSPERYSFLRYSLGDVRDRDRLVRVLDGMDLVVHAAALKQVPASERNPTEAIRTNVLGAINIIDACIDRSVKRVVALSTDKACNPVNLYGATKLCSDKLFVAGNDYSGGHGTRFSVVRYGNVIGSRGSVIPFFKEMREKGEIPITDETMTRFFITLEQGVKLVIKALEVMEGGEMFVPKIPSMNIMSVAKAIAPGIPTRTIGIRPGEKVHEIMISTDDARNTLEFDDYYVIYPQTGNNRANHGQPREVRVGGGVMRGKPVAEGFCYSSDRNDQWLTESELLKLIETKRA